MQLAHFRSSIDLKAEELITRSAGLPGSTFPSKTCFSQSTSFHEYPNAAFICFPKLSTSCSAASCDMSTMHVSTEFNWKKKKKKVIFLKCYHSNQTDRNDWKVPLSDSSSREESWTPLADWNWLMKKLSCSAADGGCRFWVFSIGSGWFLVGFLRGCFFFFLDLLFGARDFRLYLSSTVTPPLPIFASLFAAASLGFKV